MNDDREQMQRLVRSPEGRDWLVAQALEDPPAEWTTKLSRSFRQWFVATLARELAAEFNDRDKGEILRRADAITRLEIRWGVADPDAGRLSVEILAGMIDKARTGDAHRPPLDVTADPATADPETALAFVLWLADVVCETCGKPIAKATLGDDFGIRFEAGEPAHFDPTTVAYFPEPVRTNGVLSWACRRCRQDRYVTERAAARLIRERWLERSRSLDTDAPTPSLLIPARVSKGTKRS